LKSEPRRTASLKATFPHISKLAASAGNDVFQASDIFYT